MYFKQFFSNVWTKLNKSFDEKKLELVSVFAVAFLTYLLFFRAFLSPNYYFWGSDARIEYVPARVYLYEKLVNDHTFPFWTERMFLGFPIYADSENGYLNPINIASIVIFGPQISYKFLHLAEYLVGSLSIYYLLKRKKIGPLGYVITNSVYYFSTFMIDHQIHFNIILSLFLLPTAILLTDIFIEKKQLRYIFLLSCVLANSILWGHIQTSVIMFIGVSIYMLVFSIKKLSILAILLFFFLLGLLTIIETAPQVLPSYELFKLSYRDVSLRYTQGSLAPNMATFTFLPYLFGEFESYNGVNIKKDYTYTETYSYVGLSAAILALFALMFFKPSRIILFSYALVWIYLIFGFMSYNKLFTESTPLISLFRYWDRTAILLCFGVAVMAGYMIDNIKSLTAKYIPIGLILSLIPVGYIYYLNSINIIEKKITSVLNLNYLNTTYPYLDILKTITISITILVMLGIIIKRFKPKILILLQLSLVLIVFFDLIYFSWDVIDYRLQNISNFERQNIPQELENKRVAIKSLDIQGMEYVYYNIWTFYGYSQFKNAELKNYMDKYGLKEIPTYNKIIPIYTSHILENMGVSAVLQRTDVLKLKSNNIDIIKNELSGNYINKSEGNISIDINSEHNMELSTFLRYDTNWQVLVDNNKVPIKKDGLFFSFPIKAGKHQITMQYYPQPFVTGLEYSMIGSLLLILAYVMFRKVLYLKVLK